MKKIILLLFLPLLFWGGPVIAQVLPNVELELSCYGTVCENTTATYSITSPNCSDYIWNVEGGSFTGQGSQTITVDWGSPESGYGVISLDSYFCDTECKSLLSVKIPVIVDNAEIVGPEEICVGDIQQYELPMWGSTLYQWRITQNHNNEIVEHRAESPNQYLLEFTRPGTYTIVAGYACDFLECGAFHTQKTIVVKDTMSILSADSVICKGDTGHYAVGHGNSVSWQVYNQNNQYVYGTNGVSLDYDFLIPGKYRIVASNAAVYCKDADFFVTVLDNPPAPTFVQGPNEACPGNSILLSATPTSPNFFLQWRPLCSSASPSSVEGEEVSINYDAEVCDVAVYQVDNEYGCRSEAYIHTVDTFRLAPFTMPAITRVCAGASVHLWVDDQSADVTYEWTISPANAASVNGNHFSSNVEILTNHLNNPPVIATVTLKRTYCSNLVDEKTVRLYIEEVTPPTVVYDDTICSESFGYFNSTTGTLSNSHYTWIIDSAYVHHGHSANHFLPDTCLPLVLTDSPISCTEVEIRANNPTGSMIVWSCSSQYVYCSPPSSAESTTASFSEVGTHHISAYLEENGQCYRGGANVTIDCIPGMMVRYDCDGHLVVYDTSKYRDGFAMPNRTITIEGTSYFATLTDTNRITSIPIPNLPHGQYTVTMDLGMGVPCSVSRDFTFEGNPIIDSIAIRRFMCEGRPFQFSARTSGTIVQYNWNFGDGSSNKGNGIYHTYSPYIVQNPTVTLTVSDSWGCTATGSAHINVNFNNLTGTLSSVETNPVCPGQNRVIEYVQDFPVNEYYWNHSPVSISDNHYNTTSTGDYYLYIETTDYGCRAERMCNVGFLNAPTARITGNTEYCLGELVKLNGNTGNSNTYFWHVFDQDSTCVYTSTSSNIRFTPETAGDYTVKLNVTSPDGCTAQAVCFFEVHPRPAAPEDSTSATWLRHPTSSASLPRTTGCTTSNW